ncbi:hypothetical protein T265_04799 [Opisthorchis viverrini]|uniref:Uncharacterized protein n=1 Tax=Opisthorchis viverrini TaxID=6198 RepID=A0A075AG32_OPIVI|nr:hypothetical protein T265_04799 [Opisthorchis viverrini]KER28339.1 hypothetical protein T265_04799 [Opisthorchis viverrini]
MMVQTPHFKEPDRVLAYCSMATSEIPLNQLQFQESNCHHKRKYKTAMSCSWPPHNASTKPGKCFGVVTDEPLKAFGHILSLLGMILSRRTTFCYIIDLLDSRNDFGFQQSSNMMKIKLTAQASLTPIRYRIKSATLGFDLDYTGWSTTLSESPKSQSTAID